LPCGNISCVKQPISKDLQLAELCCLLGFCHQQQENITTNMVTLSDNNVSTKMSSWENLKFILLIEKDPFLMPCVLKMGFKTNLNLKEKQRQTVIFLHRHRFFKLGVKPVYQPTKLSPFSKLLRFSTNCQYHTIIKEIKIHLMWSKSQ